MKKMRLIEERLHLPDFLVEKEREDSWYAGQQLDALKYYLPENTVFLWEYQEQDYQGSVYAIFKINGVYVIWRDWFGSCSGCDGLEDNNGYEYIKDTLQEGNTKQFKTLEELKEWFISKPSEVDFFWNIPEDFPDVLDDLIREGK
jgi:hypothetical protein